MRGWKPEDLVDVCVPNNHPVVIAREVFTAVLGALCGTNHLPAEAGEARCSRSGGCGCYAAFWLM